MLESHSNSPRGITRVRWLLGAAILLLQVASIISARFSDHRYFCWAPHDAIHEYRIRTWIDGAELPAKKVGGRYGMAADGMNPRAIRQVLDSVRLTEERLRARGTEGVRAEVRWRRNGGPEESWSWPES